MQKIKNWFKDVYGDREIPAVISLLIEVVGLFFASQLEMALPIKLRFWILGIAIFFTLLPPLKYIYRKVNEIFQQHKEYPSLKQENKTLIDLNKDLQDETEKKDNIIKGLQNDVEKKGNIIKNLQDEIEKKNNQNRILWGMCQPFINNSSEYEVSCGYSVGNKSYIIINENNDTLSNFDFGSDFEFALIDIEDGYVFGDFGKPVEKSDGIHFQNLDNIDPVLQSYLEKNSGQKTNLRPMVKMIRIQKRSDDE